MLVITVLVSVLLGGCGDLDIQAERGGQEHDVEILIGDVPDYSGEPFVVINGNVPDFTKGEIEQAKEAVRKGNQLEEFTELDGRGRCGTVTAVVSKETMPDGERGSIGMVRPSGWRIDKYDFIDNGGYLYNRCHLVGWQLTGQNDEERNLITGTRYMNVEGMLPFENEVADYIKASGAHVLYRATPVFRGKDRVARGVQIEAYSLEDSGKTFSLNVYCYNVQPGVKINYKNGKNALDPDTAPAGERAAAPAGAVAENDGVAGDENDVGDENDAAAFILNTNTMRFHKPDCKGAATIKEHNRKLFYGTRDEALEAGYVPCGMCEP